MLLYISLEFEIRNEHSISLVMTLIYRLLCTFKVNFNVARGKAINGKVCSISFSKGIMVSSLCVFTESAPWLWPQFRLARAFTGMSFSQFLFTGLFSMRP